MQTDHSEINARSLSGAFGAVKNIGLRFQLVEFWRKFETGNDLSHEVLKSEFVRLVEFWNASAVIVDCGHPGLDLTAFADGRTPVVYLDCRRFKSKGGVFISNDDIAITDAAVRELLSRSLISLAFVGFPGKTVWSRNRRTRFLEVAELNGYKGIVYNIPQLHAEADSELDAWLENLPKPCGIFAANDYVARHVISCCHRKGISLPDEISVVGVDNEQAICESSNTTISSVQCDFFSAGQLAGRLACRLAREPKTLCEDAIFGVTCVVRRQSSRIYLRSDERVVKAVDYIRTHALDGIGVSDVVAQMGCSRRLAELRFREVAGCSILDEIRDVRISAAMEMLHQTNVSVSEVAVACGYSTPGSLRKAFQSVCGEALSEWRRKRKRRFD